MILDTRMCMRAQNLLSDEVIHIGVRNRVTYRTHDVRNMFCSMILCFCVLKDKYFLYRPRDPIKVTKPCPHATDLKYQTNYDM